jgi:hypothetical protein
MVRLEGLGQLKNPMTSSRIEPATFRLIIIMTTTTTYIGTRASSLSPSSNNHVTDFHEIWPKLNFITKNEGASTSHNPMGLTVCYRDTFTFAYHPDIVLSLNCIFNDSKPECHQELKLQSLNLKF